MYGPLREWRKTGASVVLSGAHRPFLQDTLCLLMILLCSAIVVLTIDAASSWNSCRVWFCFLDFIPFRIYGWSPCFWWRVTATVIYILQFMKTVWKGCDALWWRQGASGGTGSLPVKGVHLSNATPGWLAAFARHNHRVDGVTLGYEVTENISPK